jgi:hypothetical protein
MRNSLLILLFTCSMCNNKNSLEEQFTGRFKGSSEGISASADLEVRKGRLEGTVTMNGQKAEIDGDIDGTETWGRLYDATTGKKYKFDGRIEDDELVIAVIFPELNDREIELVMRRENSSKAKERGKKKSGDLDPDIIGTWKHTEILGGNSGESMTNESLMEFRDDGSCLSWPGQSSGPGYYKEEDRASASEGKWYTSGGLLHFVDPASGEDVSTNYAVNENGLLMSNGGANKKVWQRVR